jgi:hypothetical protein
VFGWIKSSAGLAKVKLRDRERVDAVFTLALAAYNLIRSWDGNDEIDEACGDGWAELRSDASLKGQICLHGGDDTNFIARRW